MKIFDLVYARTFLNLIFCNTDLTNELGANTDFHPCYTMVRLSSPNSCRFAWNERRKVRFTKEEGRLNLHLVRQKSITIPLPDTPVFQRSPSENLGPGIEYKLMIDLCSLPLCITTSTPFSLEIPLTQGNSLFWF